MGEVKMKKELHLFMLFTFVVLLIISCGEDSSTNNTNTDEDEDTTEVIEPAGDSWAAHFSGGTAEEMEDVIVTSDGNILATGTIEDYDTGNADVWLVLFSNDGSIIWQKSYGGSGVETGYEVLETPDGGFIVAGSSETFSNGSSDMWVFKTNKDGVVEWEKSYGGANLEQAWSIDATNDNGYIVAGGTESYGAGMSDCLVLKLDSNGNIIWQKAFGGPDDDAGGGSYGEYVARVFEDEDGNYIVSAITYSFGHGGSDIWVLKLDSSGNIIWQNAYGDEDDDGMWMIREKKNGGYLIPGYITPLTDYIADLWAFNLNKDGSIAWQNTYGISGIYDEALCLVATSDGGAVFGGSYYEENDTDWSLTLIRVDTDGNLIWNKKFEQGFDWANAIDELPDGKLAVAGVTMQSLSDQVEFLLLKTTDKGTIDSNCEQLQEFIISVGSTSTLPVVTNAVSTNTNITPQNTNADVTETSASQEYYCESN